MMVCLSTYQWTVTYYDEICVLFVSKSLLRRNSWINLEMWGKYYSLEDGRLILHFPRILIVETHRDNVLLSWSNFRKTATLFIAIMARQTTHEEGGLYLFPNSVCIVKKNKILELWKTILQAYILYFWPLLNSWEIKFLKCCSEDAGIHNRDRTTWLQFGYPYFCTINGGTVNWNRLRRLVPTVRP